jgi:hypothetical protein
MAQWELDKAWNLEDPGSGRTSPPLPFVPN